MREAVAFFDHGRVAGPITGSGPDADAPQHRLRRLLVAGGRFYHPPQQPQPLYRTT
jgi:hypothetical protein